MQMQRLATPARRPARRPVRVSAAVSAGVAALPPLPPLPPLPLPPPPRKCCGWWRTCACCRAVRRTTGPCGSGSARAARYRGTLARPLQTLLNRGVALVIVVSPAAPGRVLHTHPCTPTPTPPRTRTHTHTVTRTRAHTHTHKHTHTRARARTHTRTHLPPLSRTHRRCVCAVGLAPFLHSMALYALAHAPNVVSETHEDKTRSVLVPANLGRRECCFLSNWLWPAPPRASALRTGRRPLRPWGTSACWRLSAS